MNQSKSKMNKVMVSALVALVILTPVSIAIRGQRLTIVQTTAHAEGEANGEGGAAGGGVGADASGGNSGAPGVGGGDSPGGSNGGSTGSNGGVGGANGAAGYGGFGGLADGGKGYGFGVVSAIGTLTEAQQAAFQVAQGVVAVYDLTSPGRPPAILGPVANPAAAARSIQGTLPPGHIAIGFTGRG